MTDPRIDPGLDPPTRRAAAADRTLPLPRRDPRRRSTEPLRRRQLIDATLTTIGRYGLGDTTIARIGREAGLSAGIIGHYFGGKEGLLEASMRALLAGLEAERLARLHRADSAEQRLRAIVDASLSAHQLAPNVRAAWLSFHAQVPFSPALARLQRVHARRLHSNLAHALRALLPDAAAGRGAVGLATMIHGVWLQAAVTSHGLRPETACPLVEDYLASVLRQAVPGADTPGARSA